jgi:hypothetical protein
MGHLFTLDDLQKQFELARERLSVARAEILTSAPLLQDFSHDMYTFSYLRAERMGLSVISHYLNELSWLPMRLDPETEVSLGNKAAMKKWLGSSSQNQPDSLCFGNDFIHALTRVALASGWQSPEFRQTALRIGELFRDLSCLIGLIYYSVWMAENGITGVVVNNPYDLEHMAKEISDITLSPEVAQLLAQHNQKGADTPKKTITLHVIDNADGGSASPPVS